MARAKGINVVVTGNTAPLRKSLKDASQELTAFGKAQAGWSKASSLAYGVVGTAAAQFAIQSVKAALEDQKSQALLAKQLELTTHARQAQIDAAEQYVTSTMLATNITDDQLRPALAQLVRVTGSAAEAQKLLTLATDVSVGAQRDLGSVTTALSRAYTGNYGALSRLGITIDESAVSAQGFGAVTDELTAKFGGSAAAAADTLAGRVENLGVRWGELKEQIGTAILPAVEAVTDDLISAAKTAEDKGAIVGIGQAIASVGLEAQKATNPLLIIGRKIVDLFPVQVQSDIGQYADKMEMLSAILVRDNAIYQSTANAIEDQADAAARADRNVGYLRDQYRQLSDITLKIIEDEKKQREEAARTAATRAAAAKQARKDYAEQAKELRASLGEALEASRKQLQDAKDAAVDFGAALAYSFGVSLAGAYDKANDSEQDYTQALNDRKKAYDALDVAKQGDDLTAYLKAVQDVAAAEQAVTDAQKARVTPASAFTAQIEAAKTFGTNLQTLIGQGLQSAGLQQLLDLGPVAGAEVTKAILDGTAGISVGGLNESLAGLAGVQAGLASGITAALAPKGGILASQAQVDALSSASIGAPGVGQGFTINIVTGVGDPVEIGRQVKKVLSDYDTRAGSLVVQGPKKKKR